MHTNLRRGGFLDSVRGECYKVYLDGQDISKDCFEADDRAGYVVCYRRDEHGRFRVGLDNEIPTARRDGKVEFRPIMSFRLALLRVLRRKLWSRWLILAWQVRPIVREIKHALAI